MSPSATNGFYVVLHFARDGHAVFVTVGCGSTVWKNGDLLAVSDEELASRTGWARAIVQEKFGSLSPFTDEIRLGASAPLPRTFEKATAIAKRIVVQDLDESTFRDLLVAATERLCEIYEGQRTGRDLTPTEIASVDLEAISKPSRANRGGQGLGLAADERRAIELWAMDRAREWLISNGYSVKDVSATASYDFEADGTEGKVKVEVKGTTSAGCNDIFMTANEVSLHRSERGKTGLIIVSQISLKRLDGKATASGGSVVAEIGWDIDLWDRTPMAYRLSRR